MPDSKGPTARAELRVTMPQELYGNAQKAADADGRKIGDWVRRLIQRELAGDSPVARVLDAFDAAVPEAPKKRKTPSQLARLAPNKRPPAEYFRGRKPVKSPKYPTVKSDPNKETA